MDKLNQMEKNSTATSIHSFTHSDFPISWFQSYLEKEELNHRDFIAWLALWNFAGGDTENWYRLEKSDLFEMIGFDRNHKKSFISQLVHGLKAKRCLLGTFSQKKTHLNHFIYYKLLKPPFIIANDERFKNLLDKVRSESAQVYEEGLREFKAQREDERIKELQERERKIREKEEAEKNSTSYDHFYFNSKKRP